MLEQKSKAEIRHNSQASRFELEQDGKTAVLGYDLNGKDIIVFTHTEVPPELEGRGFGSQLARAGLDYARQHGLKVVSLCSFMSAFIERHLDYQDLLKT